MSSATYLAYCTAIFVASIVPGPSMLLALAQGAHGGVRAGLMGGVGNLIATATQAVVAYIAISRVAVLSPWLLAALRVAGGVYLLYLGLQLVRMRAVFELQREPLGQPPTGWQHLRSGFLVAIANPKAIGFFTALFPRFVESQTSSTLARVDVFAPILTIAFGCYMLSALAGTAILRAFAGTRPVAVVLGGGVILAGATLLLGWP